MFYLFIFWNWVLHGIMSAILQSLLSWWPFWIIFCDCRVMPIFKALGVAVFHLMWAFGRVPIVTRAWKANGSFLIWQLDWYKKSRNRVCRTTRIRWCIWWSTHGELGLPVWTTLKRYAKSWCTGPAPGASRGRLTGPVIKFFSQPAPCADHPSQLLALQDIATFP